MGSFIQKQILGMQWLNTLIEKMLSAAGLDIESRFGGSLHFFLYDVIKITILLFVLIFLISYIQSYFPPERSKKILSHCKGFSARIIAALLGTVTSFCSCSSIPLFMGFTTAGLPLGVTFSFLISSPMVDFASLILLTSIFGWKIAIAYVVLGLIVAIAGGTIIEHLHMEDQVADFIRNGKSDWIVSLLGKKNPLGVILAVFAGIPMYADIFGCISISESLLMKGALLGVVLSFMMAVTTLSLPSLIMLKKAIKTKLLVTFVSICVAGIILVGYFFNAFQALFL